MLSTFFTWVPQSIQGFLKGNTKNHVTETVGFPLAPCGHVAQHPQGYHVVSRPMQISYSREEGSAALEETHAELGAKCPSFWPPILDPSLFFLVPPLCRIFNHHHKKYCNCGSLSLVNAWEEGIRVGDMGESYTFLSFHDRMEPMDLMGQCRSFWSFDRIYGERFSNRHAGLSRNLVE